MIKELTKEQLEQLLQDIDVNNRVLIINIRGTSRIANKFDDTTILYVNGEVLFYTSCTCDSGLPNLLEPVNDDGTAIVVKGYYKGLWKLGLHRGKYEALVQDKPIYVFRDNNKDDVLDYCSKASAQTFDINMSDFASFKYTSGKGKYFNVQRGMFGINYHRASAYRILDDVGLYSAGCCVTQDPKEYEDNLDLIKRYLDALNIDEVDAIYADEEDIK